MTRAAHTPLIAASTQRRNPSAVREIVAIGDDKLAH
jgi:hypothetical protein